MHRSLKNLYLKAKQNHELLYTELKTLRTQVEKCNDMKELADTVYALRECYKLTDDARKLIDNIKGLAERLACIIWIKTSEGDKIETDYCIGTPKVKQITSVPKRGTEDYALLMDFLEIPDTGEEVVRFHWPGLTEHLTRLAEEGKPLPPGIDPSKTYAGYSLSVRTNQSKKGIDE